jgi:hypothetical protein
VWNGAAGCWEAGGQAAPALCSVIASDISAALRHCLPAVRALPGRPPSVIGSPRASCTAAAA